jgi:two-component system NtrC family sensor kinase
MQETPPRRIQQPSSSASNSKSSSVNERFKVAIWGFRPSFLKVKDDDAFEFHFFSTKNEIDQFMDSVHQNQKWVGVFYYAHSTNDQCLNLLSTLEINCPGLTRGLIVDDLMIEWLQAAVNEAHCNYCLSLVEFESRWPVLIKHSIEQYLNFQQKNQLLKDSTQRLRELESLNQNLENLVQERTRHIEASKEEEDEKLSKVRNLIKFIKELSQISDFESLLSMIRKDSRKYARISDPILIYQTQQGRVHLLSLHSAQWATAKTEESFPFPEKMGLAPSSLSQHLANYFSRPFAKVFYLPLEVQFTKQSSFGQAMAGLAWEVGLNETDFAQFRNFISERSESLSLTVDRLMLENNLLQFSYRWERTFDGFRDPIAIVDVQFEVLRSNKKFSDRLENRKCHEVFANSSKPCEGCPIGKAIESGVAQTGTIRVNERIIEVRSYPIVLEQNRRITNVVNQYVDVTQNRELYLRMLQSEKISAIGMLAGHIAHELNNPLTGIRSLAQVLIETVENENVKSDLKEIERATERSQRIIRNLLDFASDAQNDARALTWEEVVEKTSPMLKSAMRLHRQEVSLNTKDSFFIAEASLIQQVYFNLVNNACQAMKEKGILTIESFTEGSEVGLRISDTGSGIPESIQGKVFEPFFTTKKEGLGTGLGLSLSRQIIERFGGKIFLKSSSPGSTVFEIRMPKVTDEKNISHR